MIQKDKLNHIKDTYSLIEKKKSNIEHLFIEAIDAETITNEEKIKIFDNIREITLERRDYKILNNIRELIHKDVIKISKMFEEMLDIYNTNINKNKNILNELIYNENTKLKNVHLIREYPYKNHKERINLTKQLKPKYDKIVDVPERKVLACYNKCRGA